MSADLANRELVRVAEICRFVGQDSTEVKIWVEMDGLPAVKVPGKTKPALRVSLRDLHAFLMKRAVGETALREFTVFRAAFWESQEGRAA
jgi:hypothetical protein